MQRRVRLSRAKSRSRSPAAKKPRARITAQALRKRGAATKKRAQSKRVASPKSRSVSRSKSPKSRSVSRSKSPKRIAESEEDLEEEPWYSDEEDYYEEYDSETSSSDEEEERGFPAYIVSSSGVEQPLSATVKTFANDKAFEDFIVKNGYPATKVKDFEQKLSEEKVHMFKHANEVVLMIMNNRFCKRVTPRYAFDFLQKPADPKDDPVFLYVNAGTDSSTGVDILYFNEAFRSDKAKVAYFNNFYNTNLKLRKNFYISGADYDAFEKSPFLVAYENFLPSSFTASDYIFDYTTRPTLQHYVPPPPIAAAVSVPPGGTLPSGPTVATLSTVVPSAPPSSKSKLSSLKGKIAGIASSAIPSLPFSSSGTATPMTSDTGIPKTHKYHPEKLAYASSYWGNYKEYFNLIQSTYNSWKDFVDQLDDADLNKKIENTQVFYNHAKDVYDGMFTTKTLEPSLYKNGVDGLYELQTNNVFKFLQALEANITKLSTSTVIRADITKVLLNYIKTAYGLSIDDIFKVFILENAIISLSIKSKSSIDLYDYSELIKTFNEYRKKHSISGKLSTRTATDYAVTVKEISDLYTMNSSKLKKYQDFMEALGNPFQLK